MSMPHVACGSAAAATATAAAAAATRRSATSCCYKCCSCCCFCSIISSRRRSRRRRPFLLLPPVPVARHRQRDRQGRPNLVEVVPFALINSSWLAFKPHHHHQHRPPPRLKLIQTAGDLQISVFPQNQDKLHSTLFGNSLLVAGISTLTSTEVAFAEDGPSLNGIYNVSEAFEFGIQLFYLGTLLVFLGVGTFFVVRQILIRRELENAAKELQERVRTGQASPVEYFELGAVMLRKKFYPLATKYLEQAIKKWEGDAQELAQVHNALGFCYVRDGKPDKGIVQFEKAVELQPGYVTAWNNMADAYEKKKDLKSALGAYDQTLRFDPNNKTARSCREAIQKRLQLYEGVPK